MAVTSRIYIRYLTKLMQRKCSPLAKRKAKSFIVILLYDSEEGFLIR